MWGTLTQMEQLVHWQLILMSAEVVEQDILVMYEKCGLCVL